MTTNTLPDVVQKSAQNMVCVLLDVHIWSGRRHLDKTDLVHANREFEKLPEKELATLGSVKICDPTRIKAFQTIKNKAETVLRRAGLPILGAIGIPMAKWPAVFEALSNLEAEYNTLVNDFIGTYEDAIENWKSIHLGKNPEWERLFRDLPTAQHVLGRLSFKFHPFRIDAPMEGDSPLNASFHREVGGLKGELLKEVSTEADVFVQSLFVENNGVSEKRQFVTPKTLGPLRRAAIKLQDFAFIDPTIGPMATYLNDLLDQMPDEGRIDGQKLISLTSISRLMADTVGIGKLCANIAGGLTPDMDWATEDEQAKSETQPAVELLEEPTAEVAPNAETPTTAASGAPASAAQELVEGDELMFL